MMGRMTHALFKQVNVDEEVLDSFVQGRTAVEHTTSA
jgi:hypothetical protein